MKNLIKNLKETVKNEKNILYFNLAIYVIGLIVGSLFINFITKADKNLLISQLELFINSIKKLSSDVFGISAFSSILLNNFIELLILFILGISLIGIIVVIFILFFKGFMLGVTLSTFLLKYKLKGIVGMVLYVFPIYVLNTLIFIILSFFAIYASIKFIKAFYKKDKLNFKTFLGSYLLTFIIGIILLLITSLLDAYLTPLLLKIFTFLI